MISAYAQSRSGRVKQRQALFDEVPIQGLICWSSMINGHSGLEYEGWNWFYSMKERYGITPKLAHYACVVDLLSRQGNIEQAIDCVKKLPMEPDKSKHEKVIWNEKFKFRFSQLEWENLTHIKFKIMDKEFFKDNGIVGETIIHLGGIITEGTDRGFIEVRPAPYRVVLEDDTYKGQIKIGFKFIAHKEEQKEMQEFALLPDEPRRSFCSSIWNRWKFQWWRFLFVFKQKISKNEHKDD
ncbi:hypothetical protein CRYUN_Cryun23aG0138800 [Craigia yunnanensis]